MPQRYWLYSVHWQRYVGVALCLLPAGSGVFALVQGPLLFLAVVVVVVLTDLGILRCWG